MKTLLKIILLILSVLFGPLAFLLFLLVSLNTSGPYLGDTKSEKGGIFSFFFDKPKDSETKRFFRFCLIQFPIVMIVGGVLIFLSIVWTKFVFNDLLNINIDGFLDKIFSQ